MADMAKFLQKQFGEMKAQLDKVHRELIEVTAHERTAREVMATMKADLTEVKSMLHNLNQVPAQRSFPLRDKPAIEALCRKFADENLVNDIKAEIGFIFKNLSKDNFLQHFISDEATCLYKQAEDIRQLNFMKHIINDITFTPNINFTNMVSLAKARIYSARNRQNKKLAKAAAVPTADHAPPVVPALLAKPAQLTTPAKLTKPAPSAKLAPPAKRSRQETVEEEECEEEIEEEEEPEEYDDEIEGDDGELMSPEYSPVKRAQ